MSESEEQYEIAISTVSGIVITQGPYNREEAKGIAVILTNHNEHSVPVYINGSNGITYYNPRNIVSVKVRIFNSH